MIKNNLLCETMATKTLGMLALFAQPFISASQPSRFHQSSIQSLKTMANSFFTYQTNHQSFLIASNDIKENFFSKNIANFLHHSHLKAFVMRQSLFNSKNNQLFVGLQALFKRQWIALTLSSTLNQNDKWSCAVQLFIQFNKASLKNKCKLQANGCNERFMFANQSNHLMAADSQNLIEKAIKPRYCAETCSTNHTNIQDRTERSPETSEEQSFDAKFHEVKRFYNKQVQISKENIKLYEEKRLEVKEELNQTAENLKEYEHSRDELIKKIEKLEQSKKSWLFSNFFLSFYDEKKEDIEVFCNQIEKNEMFELPILKINLLFYKCISSLKKQIEKNTFNLNKHTISLQRLKNSEDTTNSENLKSLENEIECLKKIINSYVLIRIACFEYKEISENNLDNQKNLEEIKNFFERIAPCVSTNQNAQYALLNDLPENFKNCNISRSNMFKRNNKLVKFVYRKNATRKPIIYIQQY